MSLLSNLFRSPAARPAARKARLGLETMEGRLIPSVTFTTTPSINRLSIVAGQNQDNTITIRNDGNGNLRITADGVTRAFTAIESVVVQTYGGQDTVTYNQGFAGSERDTRRDFHLDVRLGYAFDSNDRDTFRANVFGDVGFVQNGAVQARGLTFDVAGGPDRDRIDFNLNDVDVRAGSTLGVDAQGFGGNDNITVDMDGEVDGTVVLGAYGGNIASGFDNDTVAVNLLFDAGSTGSLRGTNSTTYGGAALVMGNLGDDTLRFAVRQAAGSDVEVNAVLDGGLNLFDNDVGRHTTNVRAEFLEQDIVIQ